MHRISLREQVILISGDVLALLIVTIIGFASHGTAGTAGARMLTTFLPLTAAWFLVAPHLQVYNKQIILNGQQLWRPFWSMILAAPLAAWLRGLILGAPILPVFVIILGGVSALGILTWRGIYWLIMSKVQSKNG